MWRRFYVERSIEEYLKRLEEARPVKRHDDGTCSIRARPTRSCLTLKCHDDQGETLIALGFGDDPDNAEVLVTTARMPEGSRTASVQRFSDRAAAA